MTTRNPFLLRIVTVGTLLVCLLLPMVASAGIFDFWKDDPVPAPKPKSAPVTLPMVAFKMAEMLDAQLVERLNLIEGPAKGYTLIVTTPVDLNNLEDSSPLARQMGEELALWFVQSGYKVQEIRKGRTVLFEPGTGELLLTRRSQLLANENVRSAIIMASTFSQTPRAVRFNVRLIHAASNEVLAMSSQTLRLNAELRTLVAENGYGGRTRIAPSVGTRLP